jgi:colanic acid biosynthesis glycosyl transferase WcaI
MRILLASPYYAPDLAPDASLFEMLLTDLARKGHEVSVICAVPHYPTGRVPEKFRGRLFQREIRDGVHVTRVWIPSVNRARLFRRFLAMLCYQFLAGLLALSSRFDVMFTINPAFESALPLFIAGTLRRKPVIYAAWDIYPDVGIRLGIFRNRCVIGAVSAVENYCYRHCAFVHVLCEGHRRLLIDRGVPASKLAVIPLWVDAEFIRPLSRRSGFSASHNLNDAFVVLYAGNFGKTHGVDHLLETARLVSVEPRIKFVLVGAGEAHANLQREFQSAGLANALFLDFQPRENLPALLASADVSLVMLKRGFGSDSVPSKAYPIMASGRAILASVDRDCETADLVRRSRCGLRVEPEDPQEISGAILELFRNRDLCAQFGAAGRSYALQHHSRVVAAGEFERLLHCLARAGDSATEVAA